MCKQCVYELKALGATVAICLLCMVYVMNMCQQCACPAICNLHTTCPLGNHHTGCHGCLWACFEQGATNAHNAICNVHMACPLCNHHTGCHGCQWACF
jgi:hypothetical protein